MKRFFGVGIGIFLIAGTVWAEDVNKEQAYKKCSEYMEHHVSLFKGSIIPRGHKIEVAPKYNYKDLGNSHLLTWTMKSPVYLANESGRIRGTKGKTAAGCEVDKNTGEIKYLFVSDKEIIRPKIWDIENLS
jgi:hypothetical protein